MKHVFGTTPVERCAEIAYDRNTEHSFFIALRARFTSLNLVIRTNVAGHVLFK